jgi:hypothetical protein
LKKLFNLKEWLTVPDTAKHLSIVFGENVTESDVLRLALDGRLTLSVNFVNYARARKGKIAKYTRTDIKAAVASGNFPKDLKWHAWPSGAMAALHPNFPPEETKKPEFMLMSLQIGEDRFLTLSDEVSILTGIWDLPMIGADKLDIEHAYQYLTDGPPITLTNLDGTFVEALDGQLICQLQESFDDNEFQDGSTAQLEAIKRKIQEDNIDGSLAEKLLNTHKEMRKRYLEKRKANPRANDYYPAGGLPKDSVLVVRTDALREFEQSINNESAKIEKPLTTRERDTLLKLLIGMAIKGYSYDSRASKSNVPKEIQDDLATLGIDVSDDTVRKYLKQAANTVLPTTERKT